MTKEELRLYVFDHVLGFIEGNFIEKYIIDALVQAHGNVDNAFSILKKSEIGLVQGGFCGPQMPKWNWFGGWGSKCECWLPDHDFIDHMPDLLLDYKQLINYVKQGKPREKQLELF